MQPSAAGRKRKTVFPSFFIIIFFDFLIPVFNFSSFFIKNKELIRWVTNRYLRSVVVLFLLD